MATENEVEMASRLTMKDLGCDPLLVKKLPEGQHKLALCRVYGTVLKVGVQVDRNRGAEYTYFLGQFEGVNVITGEVIQSNKLYLPEGPTATLESAFLSAANKRGKNVAIMFAFEIRSVKSDKTNSGYVYETAAIQAPEQADQLAMLRQTVDKAPKAKTPDVITKEVAAREKAAAEARKSAA
jgi:hypothetical protein